MNKNICFVELTKDENGFVKASQTIQTACLRAYLKSNGIETVIYMDESLPSVADISEDILSLSDEALVFVVHKECRHTAQALISHIKELEDTEIYAIGDISEIYVEGITFLKFDEEEKLLEQLGCESKNEQADIFSVSPYKTGVLLSRDMPKYGIWLGRSNNELRSLQAIAEDLEKLSAAYSGISESDEKTILFHGFFIRDKAFLEKIFEQLVNINAPFLKFVLPVDGSLLNDIGKYSEGFEKCSFSVKFEMIGEDSQAETLLSLIQAHKISNVYFPAQWLTTKTKIASILIQAYKAKLLKIIPMGDLDIEKVDDEIKPIILDKTKQSYMPLYRGLLKSKTGLYSGVKLDGYVHHVEMPEKLYNESSKEFMNELLCVNSSLHVIDKKADTDSGKLLFDDTGTARINNSCYNEHESLSSQSRLNPSNLIIIDDGSIYINSLAYVSDSKYKQISYSEAKHNIDSIKEKFKNREKELYIFSLAKEEDYQAFLQDAEEYKKTHELKNMPIAYGYLENSCRYVISSECPVDKIPRIKIDNDSNIYPCDINTEPAAKVGASLFELSHNCFTRREKVFQERGCYGCSIRPWCPKCTEMPAFMKQSYCDVMKRNSHILDYAIVPFVFHGLIETNPQFKDLTPEEVKVSNEHMFNIIPSDIKGEAAPYLPKFTSILLCRGKYLMWTPMTNKYFNVSVEFACIIELLLKRVKAERLHEHLSYVQNIELDEAREITKYVTDTLKKAGVLYRDIE
ncbi:MAG: hypothetical protein N2489_04580 [Clostridia bacterium]|nr:hypothetical protein [Clostridia bacterium]